MYKYRDLYFCSLPNCLKDYVKNILSKKTDDFVKIVYHCGYEIWCWTVDLPISIRRI